MTREEVLWTRAPFEALAVHDLYALLQLRSEVFVLEQACAFQDLDGFDQQAVHVAGHHGSTLVAYARCFGPSVKYAEASIGRVVTRASTRGSGIGHALIERAIAEVCATWGPQPIRIGAQARLKTFYEGHGFTDLGLPYLEDGIDHLEMLWKP